MTESIHVIVVTEFAERDTQARVAHKGAHQDRQKRGHEYSEMSRFVLPAWACLCSEDHEARYGG